VGVLSVTLSVLSAANAPAQQGKNVAAEALFEEGRKLMSAGRPEEACPKFADSQRLDPALGTLLNLANCYEQSGRTASAWATFKEAASVATAAKRTKEFDTAQKRAAALAPKLSKLTITVTTPIDGLEVRRDGAVVDRAELGVPIPADPGSHKIEASAPSKQPWSTTVVVGKDAATSSVTIPALENAPEMPMSPPVTSASASAAPPPPPPPPPPSASAPPPPIEASHSSGNGQRTAGFIVGAVGVVGLGVGTIFALTAKSRYNASLDNCPTSKDVCNADGVSKRDDARSAGNIATVALGIGGAALVTGAVLVLTASSGGSQTGVEIFPTGLGLGARGSF
jgi:hypothetical protein